MRTRAIAPTLLLLLFTGCAALAGGSGSSSARQATQQSDQQSGTRNQQTRQQGPQPYEEVITSAAQTDDGVFRVHKVAEKYFYEIPPRNLDRDFVWVSRIARAATNQGYGGQKVATHVVRWERRENKVYLRDILYQVVADSTQPVFRAVDDATLAPVIEAFDVAAVRRDTTMGVVTEHVVIDVTNFLGGDVPEFSPRTRLQARSMDNDRSYVEYVKSFPENIEHEQLMTFVPTTGNQSISVVMHHSMVLLPADPMMPRLWDERVGYFSVGRIDYGTEEHRAVRKRYVTRWRLEKRNPNAALSDPVNPIIYYIDPATPEKWRPFLKQGIEDWQVAFEQAGFSNAILAMDPPDDPDWDPEDARYSVIRYLPSTTENASGPHVHDPRTGEILESDIQWYHNVMNLLRDWYFVQVGNLDPRAATIPYSDELMGRLIRYVSSHEVGHTLGLQHNMRASSSYTPAQLRDAAYTRQFGNEASIMDYGRFNYVAQPGDGATLIPIIGPYDKHAIEWGYRPIPDASSPEAEKPELNRLALRAEQDQRLRFGSPNGMDPGAQTEDLGSDPVESTRLGLLNIDRIADMLISATTRDGEDYTDLEEMYGRLVGQRDRELGHVVTLVGGVRTYLRRAGTDGMQHYPVPKADQKRAVEFLNANAFEVPDYLVDEEILRRFEGSGTVSRVLTSQQRILNGLLNNGRVERLIEQEASMGADAYSLEEMMADVRSGIWSEISAQRVAISTYRRNLQRAYLQLLDERLNGEEAPDNDLRPLIRGELRQLDTDLQRALARAANRMTRLHIEDCRIRVARILEPPV